MPQQYALLSVIFMMSFVIVFDKTHFQTKIRRFLSGNLLSQDELTRLQAIWSACQES
jgi:hypothetical protein